jgi:hypothetical protein
MRRHVPWVAAIAVAVVLTLLVRWPLAWALPLFPATAICTGPGGTVWSGRCSSLRIGAQDLGSVSWRWHPSRLFVGRLAVDVEAVRAMDRVTGEFAFGFGQRVEARDLEAQLALAGGLLPALPGALQGSVTARVPQLALQGRAITVLVGDIDVRDLRQGAAAASIGSYTVTFPDGASPDDNLRGELRDNGGPLAVSGTVTLTPEPGYVVEGLVAARADAAPALARQLEMLGRPDAQGRRPFSVAGTY